MQRASHPPRFIRLAPFPKSKPTPSHSLELTKKMILPLKPVFLLAPALSQGRPSKAGGVMLLSNASPKGRSQLLGAAWLRCRCRDEPRSQPLVGADSLQEAAQRAGSRQQSVACTQHFENLTAPPGQAQDALPGIPRSPTTFVYTFIKTKCVLGIDLFCYRTEN